MNFQERYSVLSQKSIKHLDFDKAKEIIGKIYLLNNNPLSSSSKRCKDTKFREVIFEMHFGEHRILYEVIFEEKIILIHNIEKNGLDLI